MGLPSDRIMSVPVLPAPETDGPGTGLCTTYPSLPALTDGHRNTETGVAAAALLLIDQQAVLKLNWLYNGVCSSCGRINAPHPNPEGPTICPSGKLIPSIV